MGRPRSKPLWQSDDGLVYVKERKGGHSVFDLRSGRTIERTRKEPWAAIKLAMELAGTPAVLGSEMTFAEVAANYFTHCIPIAEGTKDQPGVKERWIDQEKGLVRNYYEPVLHMRVSELPDDFIAAAELRARAADRAKDTQSKVAGIGLRIMLRAKALGLIARDRDFPRPAQTIRSNRATRRGQSQTVVKHTLPSHRSVHLFARAYAAHVGRPYMRLFWWLAFYVGFREGELVALEVTDLVRRHGRLWLTVNKKVARSSSGPSVLEPYAKGYMHRDVVVPRRLEAPLLARVAEVQESGGTLLFPAWVPTGAGPRPGEHWIGYGALLGNWVRVGADLGWEIKGWTQAKSFTDENGKVRHNSAKPSSLVWHPHHARAFAATAMYAPRQGISLRGMDMSIGAIAKQLGDTPETVRARYLGIIEDEDQFLARVVL